MAEHVYPAVDAALAEDSDWVIYQPVMKVPHKGAFTHAKRRDGRIISAFKATDWGVIDQFPEAEIVAYLPKQGYDE